MVVARLLVERGSLTAKSEDWGGFAFLGLPSPGDRIAADRGGETHYLTVLCVHHRVRPAHQPEADGGPQANVVAKWTGSG